MHMTMKGEYAESNEVSKFYYQSRNAKVFLPKKLASKITSYFQTCSEIAHLRQKCDENTNNEQLGKFDHLIEIESKLSPQIDSELMDLLISINYLNEN
ncbi:hypothetical protein [Marinicellulosiphila megalodicopiae]|uniref:hypothetical protein n=1 Tax=Marinicellulosiphila megalodicopiae TaxID=2724896 RepID=UPI003BB02C34